MALLTKYHQNDLPSWVWENIAKMCPECGTPIAQNELLTARWCPNPACPGHLKHRIADAADFFGIKGIGPETAHSLIRTYKMKTPFDAIPIWFKDSKPLVSLADISQLACIEGYGATTAEKELSGYSTFEEYFRMAPVVNPLLREKKDLLIDAQKFFRLKPALSKHSINVMGTGSFHGYSSRKEYFDFVNMLFGQYVHVIQTGERKTGIAFLLKEEDAIDHSKSKTARENNIPIITPLQFIAILCECYHISMEDIRNKTREAVQ